jgi:predicted metalloprotease with PDZ domain
MKYSIKCGCALVVAALLASGTHAGDRKLVVVEVDAREAPRGIERAHLSIPVHPGPLTLLYPKWPPGDHTPSGPIASLSGLRFVAAGKTLAWQRDALDMYAIHVDVPAHATMLEVDLEVAAASELSGLSAVRTSTPALALILWNRLVLYPGGVSIADIDYSASLTVPAGWQFATALQPRQAAADRIAFAPESLTTLVDSTVLIARKVRTIELGGQPPVFLHLAADIEAALDMPAQMTAHYRALVAEAQALFGGSHYRGYHFLWTLTDHIAHDGIEHHESSDNRSPERAVIDDDIRRSEATLLAHEYAHSWNGKFRRPIGLATRDLNEPIRTQTLWVYEGLTEYLQELLAVRSGLLTPEEFKEDWAIIAADMQTHRGREWRSLRDVTTSAQLEYDQSKDWTARTRDTDFYRESALLWLEADVIIRQKSGGRRSLDDFCRAFLGGISTAPQVKPYDENNVFAALDAIQPYDWRGFWHERLERLRSGAPLEGLEASGWHVTFGNGPSSMQKGYDARERRTDLRYSLGFLVADDGAVISDVVPGSPADVAGVAPGSTLVALDGRKWSKDLLHDTFRQPRTNGERTTLLLERDDVFRSFELAYEGGERYPQLQRTVPISDLLTEIARPRVTVGGL